MLKKKRFRIIGLQLVILDNEEYNVRLTERAKAVEKNEKAKKKIHITYKTRKNITVPECMGSLAELYLAEIPSIRSCKNYSGDLNI